MLPQPSHAGQRAAYAAAWLDADELLRAAAGGGRFELRYALEGQAAVRQDAGSAILERHVEPAELAGDEVVAATSGSARGWLVLAAPPADREAAATALREAVDRATALILQALRVQRDAAAARLTEREVHRTRADLSALEAAWDAATQNVLTEDEVAEFRGAIRETTRTAHARLSNAAVSQRALDRGDAARPLDLANAWIAATAGMPEQGTPQLTLPAGETPRLWMPEPIADWCLRTIAAAVRDDPRLCGRDPAIAVSAHPAGWELSFGAYAEGTQAEAWPGTGIGELDRVGAIAVTYGGGLALARDETGGLRVSAVFPAGSG